MIYVNGKGNRKKNRAWGWGILLILVAALVVANQFGGFLDLGFWSLAIAVLAVAVFVNCIIDYSFASLPIPIAALYYIFQEPLGLPVLTFWPLVLVTLLVTAGLHVIIPQKRFKFKYKKKKKNKDVEVIYMNENGVSSSKTVKTPDVEVIYVNENDVSGSKQEDTSNNEEGQFEEGGEENNPRISVQFGGGSRYLHANALETVELDCSFGGLEVYFDHVTLSPNGAEAFVECKFGAIELYVPADWHIIDNMSSSLGGVEYTGRESSNENSPTLKVTGNVSFGAVEVHRV